MANSEFDNIKKELETQDNAWTADPIFIVYDIEEVPTHYNYSDLYKWHSDGESYADEEVKEFLNKFEFESIEELKEGYDEEEL